MKESPYPLPPREGVESGSRENEDFESTPEVDEGVRKIDEIWRQRMQADLDRKAARTPSTEEREVERELFQRLGKFLGIQESIERLRELHKAREDERANARRQVDVRSIWGVKE